MPQTFNFLAPALHPNTLLDISIPESGPSTLEPVVKHLPIKYGQHKAVGNVKRMLKDQHGNIVVSDDAFRISTLTLDTSDETGPAVPTVVAQEEIPHRSGDVWTGLISVAGGSISALTSGLVTYHRLSGESTSRRLASPLLAIASPGPDSTTFALGGKEVDVSEWDVEATFSPGAAEVEPKSATTAGKRKKNELEQGEVWRAKNMPNNSLALRPPNHHICLTYLPSRGAGHLASGTKSGTIRVYSTQQRKPVHEWKIAREGGIGCIAPGLDNNEVFFSDRANLSGAMDLRTGRLLYSYPNLSCTPHHLLQLPVSDHASDLAIRLASIGSDASLRIHSNLPPKKPGDKGNVGAGKKAKVEGMVGGVGIGSFVFTGFGTVEVPKVKKAKKEGDEEEDGDDDGELDDEEVWDGMSEVEDEGSQSEEEEEPLPKKKARK